MKMYIRPDIKVFSDPELLETLGPTQAASGTMTVYGGARTSQLNEGSVAEYRIAKVELNHGIVTQKEVAHA